MTYREFVDSREGWTEADEAEYNAYLDNLGDDMAEFDEAFEEDDSWIDEEYDGQPSEYDEWQDYYGGDDWDHGQFDEVW